LTTPSEQFVGSVDPTALVGVYVVEQVGAVVTTAGVSPFSKPL
jgi:hypothetical protein